MIDNICDNLNLDDLPNEVWRDIVGFDGSHSVSNYGRVRREQRYDTKGRLLKSKIIKRSYYVDKKGFIQSAKVTFGAENRVVTKAVSILVAESFIGEIGDKNCVIHINKNKKDDRLENLKVSTYSESLKIDYKTKNKKDWGFGEAGNVGRNKEVLQIDLDRNVVAEFKSLGEVQKKLKYCKHTISNMCNGRWKDKPHYTLYGFRWRFK